MDTKYGKKTISERPVSLLPLPFDEILAAWLQTKRQPKKERQPRKKNATKQK